MNETTYIGPYLACRHGNPSGKKSLNSCPNSSCSNHGRSVYENFCPQCGSKITDVEVAANMEMSLRNEMLDGDRLTDLIMEGDKVDGMHFFGANISFAPPQYKYDEDRHTEFEICPIAIEELMERFSSVFAAEIEKAKRVYGEGNVQVRFGVVRGLS